MESLYGSLSHTFLETEDSDFFSDSKVKELNYVEVEGLRDSLSDYFIKNQSLESLKVPSSFYSKISTSLANTKDAANGDNFFFEKDSVFGDVWNIFNSPNEDFI